VVVIPKFRQPVVGFSSGSDNDRLQLRSSIEDYRKLPVLEEWYKVIAQIFKDYGMTQGRVGIDILHDFIGEQLKKEFPKVEFVNANGLFMELTIFKVPKEIEYMRSTMEICEIGLQAAMAATKSGVRELELPLKVNMP
jgi:Xaa-Pro aminopeptidase